MGVDEAAPDELRDIIAEELADIIGVDEPADEAGTDETMAELEIATGVELADITTDDDTAIFVHPAGMTGVCLFTTTSLFLNIAGYSTSRLLRVGPFSVRFLTARNTLVTSGA